MASEHRGAGTGVLITWPDYPADDSALTQRLSGTGLAIRRAPKRGPRSAGDVIELAKGCAAVIASTDPFSAEVIGALPELRLIARVGIGTDSIDLRAATERGVIVTSARGANEEAVADHTIGLMLATMRRTLALDGSVREGRWDRTGSALGSDLHGKTVGLIGLGMIATLVAKRLAGFDVQLLGYDPALTSHPAVDRVPMAEVLSRCDVLSVHVPLSPDTYNLIDATALAAMKPGAVLVNTSRGGVVDEDSLAKALASGHLAAAGLDVFAEEPPVTSPLLAFRDRTVLTPHIAGLSKESVTVMVRHATEAVLDVLAGRRPHDVVNPDVLTMASGPNGKEAHHGY